MSTAYRSSFIVSLCLIAPGCGGGGSGGDAGGTVDASTPPDLLAAACNTPPQCTDQSIQQLNLFKASNRGPVKNTVDGAGFTSSINATAGGIDPTESYVYAKFTDTGLVQVDLSDEAAFNSTDWDIAFRRFILRLNSGVSGPSCVAGAQLADGTTYDSVTSAPDGLSYQSETYFDANCMLVADSSGLGSPATVLSTFWTYTGCVQMTGAVYVIKRADGRRLKLTVTDYYFPAVQDTCDTTGQIPMVSTGSGNIQVRWAFLDK